MSCSSLWPGSQNCGVYRCWLWPSEGGGGGPEPREGAQATVLHTHCHTHSHTFTQVHTHTHTHSKHCCKREPGLHVPKMWGGTVEALIESLLYTQRCPRKFMCHCMWSSECFTGERTWRLRQGALSPQRHSGSGAEPNPHLTLLSGLRGVTQTGHLWGLEPLTGMLLNMETVACPLPVGLPQPLPCPELRERHRREMLADTIQRPHI